MMLKKDAARFRQAAGLRTAEINPDRPHLARGTEIAPDWLVGLNIANPTKLGIIRTACRIWGLKIADDVDVPLPNG